MWLESLEHGSDINMLYSVARATNLLDSINKDKVSSDQITIISFYPKVIQEVKRTDPNIKCNLLIAFDYKEIEINEIIDLTLSVDADGVGAQNHKRLNEEFIQSLRSNNKTVHVWTVNSTVVR